MSAAKPSRLAIAICIAFVVVGVLVVVASWAAYFTDSRIESYGSHAEGVVLRKEMVRAADGDSDYVVAYQFVLPSGQKIRAERNVPKSVWADLRVGATLQVGYSEAEPGRNFPAGGGVTSVWAPILASIVFGGLATLGGVVLFGLVRPKGESAQ